MTVEPYITPSDRAAVLADANWIEFMPGVEMANRPLWDPGAGLWARLQYRGALEAAPRLGVRLPTQSEVMTYITLSARHRLCLKPVTLSYGPEMVGFAHAVEHDRRVDEQLAAFSDEQLADAIAGIGKHWVAGASRGKARICGWWNGRKFIQAGGSDVHGDDHADYATTTMVVRDVK